MCAGFQEDYVPSGRFMSAVPFVMTPSSIKVANPTPFHENGHDSVPSSHSLPEGKSLKLFIRTRLRFGGRMIRLPERPSYC